MNQAEPTQEQDTHNHVSGKKGNEQFPVDTDVLHKYKMDTNTSAGDLLRIVVMNDQSTTRCLQYHEYHHGNTAISLLDVASFTLRWSTATCSQTEISSFIGELPLHIDLPQAADWQLGVYSPTASRRRLYKATDPDDNNRMIGVLLEQDNDGRIAQITWYKTSNSGPVFRKASSALDFSLVLNEKSEPSTDPGDIGGWTWYHSTSYGRAY